MATAQQPPDPFNSLEPLESSGADAEQKPVSVDNLNERSPSANEEKLMTTNPSLDSNNMDFTGDAPHHLVSSDVVNDYNPIYPANAFSPQAHSFFYGGYENSVGDWEDQSQYVNVDGLDIGLPGVYVENSSPVYHTGGYGYNPQMPFGPYSSVMAPVPSISGDGHLYPQQFQFPGSYYQQPAPPNLPHLSSSNPTPQADLAMPIDQQGAFPADTSNFNTQPFGPRPGYQLSYGHYGDWLISAEGSGSANPLLSPTVSPQPMSAVMPFSQSTMPLTSGMDSQQQNSLYGFGSSISPVDRGYSHSGLHHGSSFGSSFPILGSKERGSTFVDKNRRRGRGILCSCNGMLDLLNEQNRGPRANRPKNQMTEQNSSLDNENDSSVVGVDHKLYNSPDFVTEYKDAKFFIIKSYTEDNVHKSIKYGVWASTSSGNRKLDSAYHEAQRKEDPCPVFLFFSVNASAQFCGVAEMIGPVDFEKSVDYWQQDKWSGQFPVKWHTVKDVPNNIFRHIILENNDSKPVTNSRDTQEVKLEQGLEMLSLFKNHEYEVSIFDDFKFYEVREKAMQERKAHHHHHHHHHQHHLLCNSKGIVPGASMDHQRNPTAISSDFINHISKNFADAIRLEERSSVDSSADKSSSLITNITPKPDELKKPEATTVITSNYQDQQLSKSLAPGVLND